MKVLIVFLCPNREAGGNELFLLNIFNIFCLQGNHNILVKIEPLTRRGQYGKNTGWYFINCTFLKPFFSRSNTSLMLLDIKIADRILPGD